MRRRKHPIRLKLVGELELFTVSGDRWDDRRLLKDVLMAFCVLAKNIGFDVVAHNKARKYRGD